MIDAIGTLKARIAGAMLPASADAALALTPNKTAPLGIGISDNGELGNIAR